MQRLLATTMMMLMMTAALAGCAGDDSGFTQEEVDAAREEGRSLWQEVARVRAVLWAQAPRALMGAIPVPRTGIVILGMRLVTPFC